MFDISLYNDEFFEWHHRYTRQYQINTMQWFLDRFNIRSVIDFGCGIGTYLETALKNGITDIKGFDIGGEYAKKYTSPEVQQFIKCADCTEPINTAKYDAVLSFETAEHIHPFGSGTFVRNITRSCGKMILFTAAPPGQDGCGHINLQPKQYWIDLFESFGVKYDPYLSKEIAQGWKEVGCPDYISGNLIIFEPVVEAV